MGLELGLELGTRLEGDGVRVKENGIPKAYKIRQ
jgi:hypothetical protein